MNRDERRQNAKLERAGRRKATNILKAKAETAAKQGRKMSMTALELVNAYMLKGLSSQDAYMMVVDRYKQEFGEDISEKLFNEMVATMNVQTIDTNAGKPLTPPKPEERRIITADNPVVNISRNRPMQGPGVLIKESGLQIPINSPIENQGKK